MEWQNALQNFEQTPPPHCWSEIREVLDQDIPQVRHKLSDISVDPPPQSKYVIFQQLRSTVRPRQILLTRSRSVAAASIALLVGLSALYIILSPDQPPQVSVSVAGARKGDSMVRMQQAENGYIWMYSDNGNPVRISPKLLGIMPDRTDSQPSSVREWQQQVLESSFIPSGFNFMDIAELSRLLEEKND